MNSREDLHFNLSEWPTGSKSVDQELHDVIDRAFDLEAALEQIAQTGAVGPYESPHEGHKPDPWYNSLVRCGEIARTALEGKQETQRG